MKKILVLVFASITSYYFSQQKIIVTDAETQKPIPYAKLILKGKDYYRNTEENGEITLEKDEEVSEIQSFGYENLLVQENKTKYFLKPRVIEIDEVTLVKPKFAKELTIGKFGRRNMSFFASKTTWTVVDFVKNDFPVEKLYIKKLKFASDVYRTVDEATINLVFYRNENGRPSNKKVKNYVVVCKKGENITEVDFSKNPIPFPEEGYFIGFEWIINEQNKYSYHTTIVHSDGAKEKHVLVEHVAPTIITQKSNVTNLFSLSWDKWRTLFQNNKPNNEDLKLSLQLELTD